MNKIYETRSYVKECEALVAESFSENGKFYIRLDQSIFFPEEGGQHADTGFLTVMDLPYSELQDGDVNLVNYDERIFVLDGQIDKSLENKGEVVYEVSAPIPQGSSVRCVLDWEKRFDRMQNHSGEHVLTGLVHNKYGFDNVGFHLSDDDFVTLDFNGTLSYEQVIEMEKEANKIIYKNMPITDSYPSKEELESINYRSKIEIDGQVRLITIGDSDETVDVCACCAPHVYTTAEIGIIKVISVIKWKKGIQVSILCGRRALEYIDAEHDILTNISRNLSTSPENVLDVVKSHVDEIMQLKAKLSDVVEGGLLKEIDNIEEGQLQVIFTETDLTATNMKNIYNALMGRFEKGPIAVFVGSDAQGYRYNAGVAGGDARELAAYMREKLDAKGGGSCEMIQGRTLSGKTDIENALREYFDKGD